MIPRTHVANLFASYSLATHCGALPLKSTQRNKKEKQGFFLYLAGSQDFFLQSHISENADFFFKVDQT